MLVCSWPSLQRWAVAATFSILTAGCAAANPEVRSPPMSPAPNTAPAARAETPTASASPVPPTSTSPVGNPECTNPCDQQRNSCMSTAEAACELARKAAEKGASRVLGGVPGGSLLTKAAGTAAANTCQEKIAPCNTNHQACIAACGVAPVP